MLGQENDDDPLIKYITLFARDEYAITHMNYPSNRAFALENFYFIRVILK
jgi:hypothetical protein